MSISGYGAHSLGGPATPYGWCAVRTNRPYIRMWS
jgi:hypothetical protein